VAVTTGAMAQVTLSGTFNVDVNKMPAAKTSVGMGDAILSFTAKEDLGGGMAIAANTTVNTAAGRGSSAGANGYSFALTGGFGGVTLKNYLTGNASLSAGVSATDDMSDVLGTYNTRTRVQYDFPTFAPGLTASLRYDATAAATVTTGAGAVSTFDSTKYAIGYAMGPVSVAVGGSTATGVKNDFTVSYNAGIAKVSVWTQSGSNNEYTITAPVGAVNLGLHMINGDTAEATGFVASYALSKRTTVSFNAVNITKSANSVVATGTNTRVRMSHTF